MNEDLNKWFKEKWVNIGKKVDGKHPPCGTSGEKKGYAKCVPAAKAAGMSKKEKESATRRKRAAQNDAGRGGKDSGGQGKKPIYVSTKPKNETMNIEEKLNLFLEKNCPTDSAKWSASKSAAKSKFDVYPSAYANGWAAKNYKSKGGRWRKCNEGDSNGLCEYGDDTVGLNEACWDGYKQVGMKDKGGKMVPNCVPIKEAEEMDTIDEYCSACLTEYMLAHENVLEEAEYHGRKVSIGQPFRTSGGPKKFSVYVKNKKGNTVKVNFGDPNMRIKKSIPSRRKSFRARHKCATAKDRTSARFWSCRNW